MRKSFFLLFIALMLSRLPAYSQETVPQLAAKSNEQAYPVAVCGPEAINSAHLRFKNGGNAQLHYTFKSPDGKRTEWDNLSNYSGEIQAACIYPAEPNKIYPVDLLPSVTRCILRVAMECFLQEDPASTVATASDHSNNDRRDLVGNDGEEAFQELEIESSNTSGQKKVTLDSTGFFNLKLCNKTNKKVSFAFYNKYDNIVLNKEYVVNGWWDVDKNSCLDVPNMPRGEFAFYASNGSGREWAGKRKLCIEYQMFKKVFYPAYKCDKKLLKGFADITIDNDQETITISR